MSGAQAGLHAARIHEKFAMPGGYTNWQFGVFRYCGGSKEISSFHLERGLRDAGFIAQQESGGFVKGLVGGWLAQVECQIPRHLLNGI